MKRPLLALFLAVAVFAGCKAREQPPRAAPLAGNEIDLPVTLYFPSDQGALAGEHRTLKTSSLPEEQVAAVVRALLEGPEGTGLSAPFPEGTSLGSCYLSPEGVAFVDLKSQDGGAIPGVGSSEEIQIVYSLVDSVAMNVNEARRVVILWNGVQPASFGGHLDTSRPLAPWRGLVR
ncbi:MAG: GerMN domain-containing protein [Thermoanaerobaculia bacterium]